MENSQRVPCGLCARTIEADEAKHCWFCFGPLCADCWETIGHCGHEDADRLAKRPVAIDDNYGYTGSGTGDQED